MASRKTMGQMLNFGGVKTINMIFLLHYKVTFLFLLLCGLNAFLIATTLRPMTCVGHNEFSLEHLSQYCSVEGVKVLVNTSDPESLVPYHGDKWYVATLLIQAVLFLVPYFLWISWEDRRLERLMDTYNYSETDRSISVKKLGVYLRDILGSGGSHHFYFYIYFLCELLNHVVSLSQLIVVSDLIGGITSAIQDTTSFVTEEDEEKDPISALIRSTPFPRAGKCVIHKYSPSGSVMRYDNLCFLPANVRIQEIFIVVYVWFFILTILSFLVLLYRLMTILIPPFRLAILQFNVPRLPWFQASVVNRTISDWYLIRRLFQNMAEDDFRDLLKNLAPETVEETTSSLSELHQYPDLRNV
ncbi:innexin shaking-B-like [Tachypleus tridentatus]|uniref:innexin shaking-B-like n=1 Tax=Tachypleus tridentatus TaxID=6853 RepID=UPI003FD5B705